MKNNLTVETREEVSKKLIGQWNTLWNSSSYGHFSNSYGWFQACRDTFKFKKYKIICCFIDNELVGVLPLIESKRYGVKAMIPPGGTLSDKSELLIKDNSPLIINRILDEAMRLGSLFIPEIDEHLLRNSLKKNINTIIANSSSSPYLPTGEDAFRFFSKRRMRKLLKKRGLSIKQYDSDLNKYFHFVKEIENGSFKKKELKQVFDKQQNCDFYKNIIKRNPGGVLFNFLLYKTRPIAYEVDFKYKNTIIGSQKGYLLDYRQLVPGKVLTLMILSNAADNGCKIFDLGRGLDTFKLEFTPYVAKNVDYYYSRNIVNLFWWKSLILVKIQIEKNEKIYDFLRVLKNRFTLLLKK